MTDAPDLMPIDSGAVQPPTAGLGDQSTAAALRDIMTTHINKTLKASFPPAKRGRVVSVDFLTFTAQVWFAGDVAPQTVKLFSSTLPGQWGSKLGRDTSGDTSVLGAGSQVLVQKFFNSLYITEVLTGGQFSIDWSMAGARQQAFGLDSTPEYVRAAEYVYHTHWDQSVYGNGGGPYAINIGPFLLADTIDVQQSEAFGGNNGNGAWEIDVISQDAGSSTYEFSTWPTRIFSDNFFATADNGYNGSFDIWFRLLASRLNNDSLQRDSFAQINPYNDAYDAPLTGWDNSADTQVTVTRSTTIANPEDPTNANAGLIKMQSNTSHATLKIAAGTATRTKVMPGCRLSISANLLATVANAATTLGIDWYTSANALISTATIGANSLVANTWKTIGAALVAPTNAAYANFYFQFGGTPATTTIFYCSSISVEISDISMMPQYTMDLAHRRTIHGSPTDDPLDSPGELWLRMYINWLPPSPIVYYDYNMVTDGYSENHSGPEFIIRVRNTGAFSTARSTKTGLPVYEYDTAPVAARGYYGYTDGNNGATSNQATQNFYPGGMPSTGPWRNPDLLLGTRVAQTVTLGGLPSYETSALGGKRVKWTSGIEIGGLGRSNYGLRLGYASLSFPAVNAFIPVFPSPFDIPTLNTVTVDTDGIPMTANQSLWLLLPPGLNSTTAPNNTLWDAALDATGGLFIIDPKNIVGNWVPPEHAICIARINNAGNQMRFINGQYYGGTLTIGDALTTVNIPGTLDSGDEVFGSVSITVGTGGTAPMGSTAVSYTNLAGGGSINGIASGNSTSSALQNVSIVPGAASTTVYMNRTSATATTCYYRVKQAP